MTDVPRSIWGSLTPDRGSGAERCLVMGILNVTPDSFSDGGKFLDVRAAVEHALALAAAGADIVDVGGESTRPQASRVDDEEERSRVVPVVRELTRAGLVVSVDTMRASTAAAAVDAGAVMVNDVSGGLADEDMARLVGSLGVDYVAMHWRGHSDRMQERAEYGDVVADVNAELASRVDALVCAGVQIERIILDPGLGFAKKPEHNWQLLARLGELASLGRPLLIGASRKSFLGELLGEGGRPRPADLLDDATAAVSALAAAGGAAILRVHGVRKTVEAVSVAQAVRSARHVARGTQIANPARTRLAATTRDVAGPEPDAFPIAELAEEKP